MFYTIKLILYNLVDNRENCQGSEKYNRISLTVLQPEPELKTNPSVKIFN